jgi:hypothetical protein
VIARRVDALSGFAHRTDDTVSFLYIPIGASSCRALRARRRRRGLMVIA